MDVPAGPVAAVDHRLRAILDAGSDVELYRMMEYQMGWRNARLQPANEATGKRFRPMLCMLVGAALGAGPDRLLPAAAAVELVHQFSLVLDDIQDGDEMRRGRAALWKVWGVPQALNVAAGMEALAVGAVFSGPGPPPEKRAEAARLLIATMLSLCEGQYLDLLFEHTHATVLDYFNMISRKTAALIECSTHLGALFSTDDEETILLYRRFGRALGMAFQIADDVKGIWGTVAETGKPAAGDLVRRKKTLPVLYGLTVGSEREKAAIRDFLAGDDPHAGAPGVVREILDSLGADGYCRRLARGFAREGRMYLEKTGVSNESQHRLIGLIDLVSEPGGETACQRTCSQRSAGRPT